MIYTSFEHLSNEELIRIAQLDHHASNIISELTVRLIAFIDDGSEVVHEISKESIVDDVETFLLDEATNDGFTMLIGEYQHSTPFSLWLNRTLDGFIHATN